MSDQEKRYFVTIKRLQNPNFNKTIKLFQNMGQDKAVYIPHKTVDHLKQNWHTTSIPNLVMCMKLLTAGSYSHYYFSARWTDYPEAANQVFKYIFENEEDGTLLREGINSEICSEENLNFFIDSRLSDLITVDNARYGANDIVGALTDSKNISTYQYEKVYNIVKSKNAFDSCTDHLKNRPEIIPDVILKEFMDELVNRHCGPPDEEISYDDRGLFTEVLKRNMIEVKLQPAPLIPLTFGIKPATEPNIV